MDDGDAEGEGEGQGDDQFEAPPDPIVEEIPLKLKKPTVVRFPKRTPSVVIPVKTPVYITADKTTCAVCPCFPKESPYMKHPRLKQCLQSPLTLYEYAASAVDSLPLPEAFNWSANDVAKWMGEVLGLPQYKIIETAIHKLYSTEFILFARSIGLPPRKPLTHCTWVKSKTGSSLRGKHNWSRCDVLRWMKILDPVPVKRDHWDLVWYQKPDFPKTLFARIPAAAPREKIPRYIVPPEVCKEYQTPRKYVIVTPTPVEKREYIWNEPKVTTKSRTAQTSPRATGRIKSPTKREWNPEKKVQKESRLIPKKICLEGLTGKDLILARRLMPKQKFVRQ